MTRLDASTQQGISDEAKRFCETAKPLERRILANGGVKLLRAAEHADTQSTNEMIVQSYVECLDEGNVAGVPVQTVIPKDYDSSNDGRAVLYFFGGAYVTGSPFIDLAITARLAFRLGVRVCVPYYRRAPEHPYPAAIDDGFMVYEALLETLGAANIGVAGESAGGNLALAVVLRAGNHGLPSPAAVVLMSPWCDLTPVGESQQQPAGFDPTLDYKLHLEEAAGAYAGAIRQDDPRISPLYAEYDSGFPPTLITTGTRELFQSDCARLADAMRKEKIDVTLRVWEGMWHTFEWYHDIPEADQSMDEIAAFLKEHLGH